jgi:hypothetical protein
MLLTAIFFFTALKLMPFFTDLLRDYITYHTGLLVLAIFSLVVGVAPQPSFFQKKVIQT